MCKIANYPKKISDSWLFVVRTVKVRYFLYFGLTAELLTLMKDFAKAQQLNLNDVIEASVTYIKVEEVKDGSWRYPVEI